MKRTYRVTFDGQTFTRQTARTYTHVVVARRRDDPKLYALAWCGRVDLANKQHDLIARGGSWVDIYSVDLPQP